MKLDWQLIRKILLAVEAQESPDESIGPDDVDGWAPEVVSYHVWMLIGAGLVQGRCRTALGDQERCYAERLTFHGHEFLETIRRPAMWNEIVKTARDRGLELSFSVVQAVATMVVKKTLGL